VLVQIEGNPAIDKRIIKTAHGRIEFLGDGQQALLIGAHPSGARYEWQPKLPVTVKVYSREEFELMWSGLQSTFGVEEPMKLQPIPSDQPQETPPMSISEEGAAALMDALWWPKLRERCADNDAWSEVGYALLSLGPQGKDLFCEWSKDVKSYAVNAPEDWWAAHADQAPRTDYRHIFTLARRLGYGAAAPTSAFDPVVWTGGDSKSDGRGAYTKDPLDIEQAPPPEKPQVRLSEGQLHNIVEQATGILAPVAYKQGSSLVRIGRPDEEIDGTVRRGDYRSILRISPAYVRVTLGDIADFVKYDGRTKSWRPADCPLDVAMSIISMGDWPRVREIEAIARAPFVRLDGSVCEDEGYDTASSVFLMKNADFPKLPDAITRDTALEALTTLLAPFREIPYASASAESAFAAHILTEAARSALRTSPMFFYTAPDPGTGKSLLSEMPSIIIHGVQPATRPWVSNSEEIRKTLFASLMIGDRSILFDNIPSGCKVRLAELCLFLTSPRYGDRKLGGSELIKLPNRAVVSGTGNNITPVGDLARRSIVIRLDANSVERKQRRFKIPDLRAYARTHRVRLLMAALTVIVGWQRNAASDAMPVPLPAFEDWSYFVREPLIWLGMPDPVETQIEETDDEADAVGEAFKALGAHFAGREFYALSLRDLCGGFTDTDGNLSQLLIAAGCQDPLNPAKLGYWLRNCRDKIGGGYKLIRGGRDARAGARWVLKPINGDLV
jgi:hypothetical protein